MTHLLTQRAPCVACPIQVTLTSMTNIFIAIYSERKNNSVRERAICEAMADMCVLDTVRA